MSRKLTLSVICKKRVGGVQRIFETIVHFLHLSHSCSKESMYGKYFGKREKIKFDGSIHTILTHRCHFVCVMMLEYKCYKHNSTCMYGFKRTFTCKNYLKCPHIKYS